MLGDSVEITEGYRIVVVLRAALHLHAGLRLRLRLRPAARAVDLQALRRRGRVVRPGYLELLRAGGSRSPEELGAIVGIDLADPGFWDSGLDLVEAQLEEAEEAANASLART